MKNKEHNSLHDLVHSLSPSEKRYFKQHAGQHTRNGKSNYIDLFDAISEMPEWSISQLKEKLPQIANLPSTINQLNDLIFKALGQLSRRHNPIHQLRDLMDAIENAYDKGLWSHYEKLIKRAENLAMEHDKYQILLELAKHRRELAYRNPNTSRQEIEKLKENETDFLHQIQIDSQYAMLYHSVKQEIKSKSRSAEDSRKRLEGFLKDELIASEPKGKSLLSRISHHNIRGMIAFAMTDFAEYHRQYKLVLDLWHANPHHIEINQGRYLDHLHSYMGSWSLSNDGEGFRRALDEFRKVKMKSDVARLKQEEQLYIDELLYLLNYGDYDARKVFVASLTKWLQKNSGQILIASRLLLYYNIAIFHFLYEEYTQARAALSAILQAKPSNDRAHIRNFAPLLDLVCLYELRRHDHEYYDSLFESRFRRLDRKEKKDKLSSEMLRFIRRSDGLVEPAEIRKVRVEMKEVLDRIINESPGDRPPTGSRELAIWLEARIEDQSVGELFEKKLQDRDQPNRTTK